MAYCGARVFPADYGLLGLLLDGPAHGYDLQQRLRDGLGPVWHVAFSQLYSVLRRLERNGWVDTKTTASPDGPPRHQYRITAQGRRAFFDWAVAPVPRLRDVRIELLAKLYFLRRHAPEELGPLLRRQSELLREAKTDPPIQRGDPWIAAVAQSFRHHQTKSALAWIGETERQISEDTKEET